MTIADTKGRCLLGRGTSRGRRRRGPDGLHPQRDLLPERGKRGSVGRGGRLGRVVYSGPG